MLALLSWSGIGSVSGSKSDRVKESVIAWGRLRNWALLDMKREKNL